MESVKGEWKMVRVDEYCWVDRRGKFWAFCLGCEAKISVEEFTKEKGYCSKCRDGKNEWLYREKLGR